MLPDIDTMKYWAFWNNARIPRYELYRYQYYIPQLGLFVFQQYKGKRMISMDKSHIQAHCLAGTFRPFVLVTPKSDASQGGVA